MPRLLCRRGGGYSETARSHPHARRQPGPRGSHLEAVGRFDRLVPHSVLRWRLADDGPERPAEGPQAREADVVANVGDAPLGLAQQEHRPLDPATLEVAVWRLAEAGVEAADEVGLGKAG